MTLENLITVRGTFVEAFSELEPDTIQHASEIMNERRTDKESRRQWFWTADSALYTVEDGEAVLYLGSRDTNPIFKNIQDATSKLRKTGNYVPSQNDVSAVVKADGTIRVKLLELDLKGTEFEWQYFKIDTSDFDGKKLNVVQRVLAERAYGSMEARVDKGNWPQSTDFGKNMKMLHDSDIGTTRFYVLNPQYVKEHVEGGSAICRACGLDSFDCDSRFPRAKVRDVDSPYNGLRGVRKAKIGAQQQYTL